jgi:hypothetical protein
VFSVWGKIIGKMNGLCWVSIGEKVRKLAIYWVRIFEVPDQIGEASNSKFHVHLSKSNPSKKKLITSSQPYAKENLNPKNEFIVQSF